jgi:hypothetical protein
MAHFSQFPVADYNFRASVSAGEEDIDPSSRKGFWAASFSETRCFSDSFVDSAAGQTRGDDQKMLEKISLVKTAATKKAASITRTLVHRETARFVAPAGR